MDDAHTATCGLSMHGSSVCTAAYVGSAISILLSVVMMALQVGCWCPCARIDSHRKCTCVICHAALAPGAQLALQTPPLCAVRRCGWARGAARLLRAHPVLSWLLLVASIWCCRHIGTGRRRPLAAGVGALPCRWAALPPCSSQCPLCMRVAARNACFHASPRPSCWFPPPHSPPAAVVGMSWALMCLFIVSFFLSSASASAAARERAALEEKLAGPAPGSKHPHHAEVRRPGGQAAGSAADTDPWMARSLLSRRQEQPPSPVFFSSPLSLCGRGSGWPWAGWRIACCCILQRPNLDTESSAAALPTCPAGDPVGNQAGSRQALQPAAGLAAVLPLQVFRTLLRQQRLWCVRV